MINIVNDHITTMRRLKTFRQPDVSFTELKSAYPDFHKCIQSPSLECTVEVVGNVDGDVGYCSEKGKNGRSFADTIYCACVNSILPNPECIFNQCANNTYSYKPHAGSPINCPQVINCDIVQDIDGEHNIVNGVVTNCGIIYNISQILGAYPVSSAILLVIIVCLNVTVFFF